MSDRRRQTDPEPLPESGGLLQVLEAEAERCRRYNHFFSVIALVCPPEQREAAHKRMRSQLRASDSVMNLEGTPQGSGVGAILPETNRAGAQAATDRLRALLADVADARLGLALYPDDGAEVRSLLGAAVDSAA